MIFDKSESKEIAQNRHDVIKDRQDCNRIASYLLEKINAHQHHSDGCDGNPSKAWCERCTAISIVGDILREAWVHGAFWQRAYSHQSIYYEAIKAWTFKHIHLKK